MDAPTAERLCHETAKQQGGVDETRQPGAHYARLKPGVFCPVFMTPNVRLSRSTEGSRVKTPWGLDSNTQPALDDRAGVTHSVDGCDGRRHLTPARHRGRGGGGPCVPISAPHHRRPTDAIAPSLRPLTISLSLAPEPSSRHIVCHSGVCSYGQ